MNKIISSTIYVIFATMLLLSSCDSEGKAFRIQGEVISAEYKTLYLEHRGLGGVELLDSVNLPKNGKFSFKEKVPQNPEFYQLRIEEQKLIFAVDSNETLVVKADASDLYGSSTIESSLLNDQIKDIIGKQLDIKKNILSLTDQHTTKVIDDVTYLDRLDSILSNYKAYASKLILGNPSSAAAYYAVFQKIDDYLIFDPYNKKDYAMFGAVATSWNRYYPETQRTKHLYDFTMNALKVRKQQERQSELMENITITESTLPDISLNDVKGNKVSLSSFNGSFVILDFTAYKADFSLQHNELLNQIYRKYNSKGLEIYQISFDSDAHYWKNAASELPWKTVYDPQSVNSSLLRTYNVRELPTTYILNREGDLIKRIERIESLETDISQLF
ncbi:MAG TPA: TlpA disulfide reductase family protein [Dysgonamonadaceae bacterium]|nr:TlpA disulfide reductase family protein [Dysgonamonadaceae bacterium]